MVEILRETKVAAAFRQAAKNGAAAVVAAPFWGKGAVAALGLTKGQPIRIVCNLDQPGCNPLVIAEIRRLGIKVRTHPRLHAKIYATPTLAIVGSSNVSSNGMTLEGKAAQGWIEANVADTDPAFVAAVQALFKEIWSSPETRPVTAADIKAALANRPPPPAPPLRSKTLLAACRENPKAFASVYVVPYDEDLSDIAKKKLATVKQSAKPPKPGLTETDFRRAQGYQTDPLPEGAWLVGLDCRGKKPARFAGCSRVVGLSLPIEDESDLNIVLPGVIRLGGHRLAVSQSEKAALVAVAKKLLGLTTPIPLARGIKLIDNLP